MNMSIFLFIYYFTTNLKLTIRFSAVIVLRLNLYLHKICTALKNNIVQQEFEKCEKRKKRQFLKKMKLIPVLKKVTIQKIPVYHS